MILHTASEVISFVRKLEEDSAKYYEDLAGRYTEHKEILLSFARENKKNITHIERAYYGIITDALEGCFSFNINPDEYAIGIEIPENAQQSETLKQAADMEEKIIKFYHDAAEQSKSFMGDVARAFTLVAKKRGLREQRLKELI